MCLLDRFTFVRDDGGVEVPMSRSLSLSCLLCGAVIAGIAITSGPVYAGFLEKLFAPKAKLWSVWTTHDPDSKLTIDHDVWSNFLKAHVEEASGGVNRIDYARVPKTARDALASYLRRMEEIPISEYSRDEQLAYWVNLYNALTISVVLEHYPVASIRDINLSKGLFSKGPWNKKLLTVEGREISLNDIEHRILRPIWKDPRIHYAVNCASIGCPNLLQQSFTANNVHELLEKGAHDYVNHPRGASVESDRLRVSSIYVWFESDFGGNSSGVISHLKQYADESLASALEQINKISDNEYDWALNDVIQ